MDDNIIKKDKRKWIGLVIIGLVLALFIIEMFIKMAPSYSAQFFGNQLLLWALWNICFILILVLLFLYFRYLRSIYIERKRKILGYKFKVKLVVSFIGLALIPSILLVIFGVNLINGVIEGWFKTPVGDILSKANDISERFYANLQGQTKSFAWVISDRISNKGLWLRQSKDTLDKYLNEKMQEFSLERITVKVGDRKVVLSRDKEGKYPEVFDEIEQTVMQNKTYTEIIPFKMGDYVRAVVPLYNSADEVIGYVAAAIFVEPDIAKKVWQARGEFNKYKELSYLKQPIKRYYFNLFLMITLLILFGVSWIGFKLAKEITIPIQMLAEGTKKISEGDLDYRINFESSDEIGMLITSFNTMAEEIQENREALEKSNVDLKNINISLEERRRYIETILNTITTGVITLDENKHISTINPAANRILRLPSGIKSGQEYKDFFVKNNLEKLAEVMESYSNKKRIMQSLEIEVTVNRRIKYLAIYLATMMDANNQSTGIVMVIEDLTEMVKAQKVVTWQEIARRIAHEINNPLTPIQLSAEHIRKKLNEDDSYLKGVLTKDANSIIEGVQTLKTLVNEFSRFARLPAMNKQNIDLHSVIQSALNMYDGVMKNMEVQVDFDNSMPAMNGDAEQLKRVVMNIIENAVQAMNNKGKLNVMTSYDSVNAMAHIEICDDGPGISPEERDKIFAPYFSTKKKGMGLGLAIVERIISDHGGTIRAEDNMPAGVKFLIEIPIG